MGGRVVRALGVVTLVALATFVGPPAQAAFPGQNGRIAFTERFPGTVDDIHSVNPDGSGKVNLTNSEFSESWPNWNAAGTKLIFSYCCNPGGAMTVINADGTGRTTIREGGSHPSWSPDEASIVYIGSATFGPSLNVMDADTTTDRVLLDVPNLRPAGPRFSPDGKKIVFFSDTGCCGQGIWVINADGTGFTGLTDPAQHDVDPDWSPDGSRVVFASRRSGNDDIYIMNADGTGQTRLTNTAEFDQYPVFSPDGSRIAFTRVGRLHTMALDGSDVRPIGEGGSRDLSWQPIPGPQRSDYENASAYCKALRDFLGDAQFSRRYKNHGKCVSTNH